MNEVLKKINVDLSRSGNTRLIFARQNDRDSRKLRIKLLDSGEDYPVNEEHVATLNVLRPDGDSFAVAAEVTDGVVEVTLPYRALAVAGLVNCSISIYSEGDRKLTSDDFTLEVKEAHYKGDDIAEDEDVTLLISLISEISEMKVDEKARILAEESRESAEAVRVAAEKEDRKSVV